MNLHQTRTKQYSRFITLIALVALFISPGAWGQQAGPELPKAKQTSLGLYVTAREAYEM